MSASSMIFNLYKHKTAYRLLDGIKTARNESFWRTFSRWHLDIWVWYFAFRFSFPLTVQVLQLVLSGSVIQISGRVNLFLTNPMSGCNTRQLLCHKLPKNIYYWLFNYRNTALPKIEWINDEKPEALLILKGQFPPSL